MVEIYRKIRLLGEGAFGKCYLVDAVNAGNKCVIKQMDISSMTPEEKNEALREAKILEALDHPNITRFREVYKTRKGRLCLVMDYADGGDLQQLVKQRAKTADFIPEDQIWDYFVQICLAVKHVHDRKILHRDIKSQNIFIHDTNIIKLGDFGIAKVFNTTKAAARSMVGTPYYLSPEIIENRPYNFKSDIWSIGVLLYEICTLKPPFDATSLHFLALKIVRGNYPPPPEHYSHDLRGLIRLLLAINPDDRPTITQILQMPFITSRIQKFLSKSMRMEEFSHTVLHNESIFRLPPPKRPTTSEEEKKEPQPAPKVEAHTKYEDQRKQMLQDIRKKKAAMKEQAPSVEIYEPNKVAQEMAYDFQEAVLVKEDEITAEQIHPPEVLDQADRIDSEEDESPSVSSDTSAVQSEYDKTEALRQYLEQEIGDERFIQAYHIVHDIDESESEGDYADQLGHLFSMKELAEYLPLIRTLIYLDNFLL